MFSRRVKPEPQAADKGSTVIVREARECGNQAAMATVGGLAGRKPSERFTRKPLQARSRASHSERRRVAELTCQLERTVCDERVLNGVVQFNSYKPGAERPPG